MYGPEASSRMIRFDTEVGLRRLAGASTVIMDGNFSIARGKFSQVYVIRIPFRDVSMTYIFAFLQNKSRSINDEFFEDIVDKCEEYGFENGL